MLDIIKSRLAAQPKMDQTQKYNYLREYLQLVVLKILDEKGYFRQIAFVGGTALRILYQLNRFSEDLDFSLVNEKEYSFRAIIHILKQELQQRNLSVDLSCKDEKSVASSFIRFDKILYELGLSSHRNQKLSIKFEVDQRPPLGYKTELTLLNNEFLISINHYDLPSLFAGKLHAILHRPYAKGRDYYDLIWYLSRKVTPNYLLLNQAILQTEKKSSNLNQKSLKQLLLNKITATDFKKIRRDVAPFLADGAEARFFEEDFFLKLIQSGLK